MPSGANGAKFEPSNAVNATMQKNARMPIFRNTMIVFAVADSLVPRSRRRPHSTTTRIAGMLNTPPFSPGGLANAAGICTPKAFEELGVVTDIGMHRQSGTGLDELAQRRGASVVVIGSAPGGTVGRIQGGTTSEQLLHGSHLPVAIAPTGYADAAPDRIERLVVAVDMDYRPGRLTSALDLLPDVVVELVCVVRRATSIYTTQLGVDAELEVLHVLRAQAADALSAAQVDIRRTTETHVLVGDTVDAALAEFIWHREDLLVCGSSTLGPVRRVLLGDMTFRLLRASTVPVLVAPRPG